MNAFIAMLKKELLEQWRSYRLLIAVVVLSLFGLTSPLMAKYTPEIFKAIPGAEQFAGLIPVPSVVDAVAQFVKNTTQFGVLLALLLPMGAVAIEKERGTAVMTLVKPLPRIGFLGAKLIALTATFTAGMLVAGLGSYYYTVVLFGPTDFGAWMGMSGLILVYILTIAAQTLFFSALFRSQAAAAGASFGVLLFVGLIGAIPSIAVHLPSMLSNWGAALALGKTDAAWSALWVSLAWIAVSVAAGWAAFRRQEL